MNLQATTKGSETSEVRANAIHCDAENSSADQESRHEQIRRRAYEIYLERDGFPGNELDDWLQAERELERARCPKHSD
jgi:hypothetical protein